MKNILITLFYADGLHGGVKYSAELGRYFISRGYSVYIAGVVTHSAIKQYFNQFDIHYFNVGTIPTDIVYDIVWAHHFPIVPYLIGRGLRYNRLINSCISNILLIERIMWFHENIDLYLTLTNKTKNMFVQDYNIPQNKIKVLPNTAPDEFFSHVFEPPKKIKKIVIVSNHPPREIIDAIPLLRKRGIKITVCGGRHPVDVTPDVLSRFDAVISIGKTVQYALAMGVPVYNYDHFGGVGYITPENIDTEEQANFSGRSSFTKKTSDEIVHEIISNYFVVVSACPILKQIAIQRYKLSNRLNEVLSFIAKTPAAKHITITNENRLFFDYCRFIIENSMRHIRKRKNRLRRIYNVFRKKQ